MQIGILYLFLLIKRWVEYYTSHDYFVRNTVRQFRDIRDSERATHLQRKCEIKRFLFDIGIVQYVMSDDVSNVISHTN